MEDKTKPMPQQHVIISQDIEHDLADAIAQSEYDRVFVLTDETTRKCCFPKLEALFGQYGAMPITISEGDTNKTVDTLCSVWTAMQRGGATRHSLLINLGGGMVTDLGGFAAATFKRGIDFINIPTTLLAMVDASVGGKTGVNFGGLKNEVGAFADARTVIISTRFLDTLDAENIRSGYAEMLKHALISDEKMWAEHVNFCLAQPNLEQLQRMVADSIALKERVVRADPHEHGIRKALNLGHTVGHALEAWAMKHRRPMLHGYAVAHGLVAELYLSTCKTGFSVDRLRQTARFIRDNYGATAVTCDDYDTLLELMRHDKKNTAGSINFTLLGSIGGIRINQTATEEEIKESLDFLREGF